MSSGPEHYRKAERLLAGDAMDVAAAQTHAILAQAASNVITHVNGRLRLHCEDEWLAVTAPPAKPDAGDPRLWCEACGRLKTAGFNYCPQCGTIYPEVTEHIERRRIEYARQTGERES